MGEDIIAKRPGRKKGREGMKKLISFSFLMVLWLSLCGQALASGNIIERKPTKTEVIDQTRDDVCLTPVCIPYIRPPSLSTCGIMWNEETDTYIRIGDPYLFIHEDIKRCILADNGTVVYYLDGYNREGVSPSVTGTCDTTATKKLTDTGVFTGLASDYVGHYAHDTTDDVYSLITAKDNDNTLSLQDDIFVSGDEFEICTGVFNGDDGQVMVEIPAFRHKYWYDNGWHGHLISYDKIPGYELHHAFQKNGDNVTARYIGAYEGVLYDTSEGKYVNGLYLCKSASHTMTFDSATSTITSDTLTHPFTNLEAGFDTIVISETIKNDGVYGITAVTDTTITVDSDLEDEANVACVIETQRDWNNDILGSVAGKAPINMGTRANFRTAAANRGAGWRQQDFDLISAIQLLYLIEYGSWYSRSEIGPGLTDWEVSTLEAWNSHCPIERTGLSNSLGSATGSVSNGDGIRGSFMSYRGIENLYGHLSKMVDGINVYNHIPYVCNNDTYFADDTTSNYIPLGIILPDSNGYTKTLAPIARGFLPTSIGGSSSTYVTDYYWQNPDWRIVRLSSSTCYGKDRAGIIGWHISIASDYTYHRGSTGRLAR